LRYTKILDNLTHVADVKLNMRAPLAMSFQYDSIPDLNRSEDDLIDGFLLNNSPRDWFSQSVESPEHGYITGILNCGIKMNSDEVKECFKMGVAIVPHLLFSAFPEGSRKR